MSNLPFFAAAGGDKLANLMVVARGLAARLARGRPLDRKAVAEAMTVAFGATDAEGAWTWRDAYEAQQAAQVLDVRRHAAEVCRLEADPQGVTGWLAARAALGLSHTRRSEARVALDQFSSPLPVGALAVLAAQVRPGDKVLEPSAGTGLLAILAEACGGGLTLNEPAWLRCLLANAYPRAPWRSQAGV